MRPPKHKPAKLGLDGAVWLTMGADTLGGEARVALLRAIAEQGSITHAAKACGLSYKGAWDAVEAMNVLSGDPLVERSTGGRGGGSTRLTEHGQRLVDRFAQIDAVHRRFLSLLDAGSIDLQEDFSTLKTLNLKTSARNQFVGVVTSLRSGAVNDEVELTLPGGERLVAVITRESTLALGLRPQMAAIALVKSSSVMVAAELGDARLSARNQWPGRVRSTTPGAVNAEVVIGFEGGGEIVAIVPQAGAQALSLEVGDEATAVFDASSVIVAVMA